MRLLLDFDSILYHAVYRIVSFEQMRSKITDFGKEGARQWLLETVYNEGVERCEKEIESIKSHLGNIFFEDLTETELFITTCRKSFRKELSSSYKSNRKANKYVWLLREHFANNGAKFSDTHEADDLIAERAIELGVGNYLVCSIDKDLKQIGGHYWSYYKQNVKDENGEKVLTEWGWPEREYKQPQVDFISEEDAKLFFWAQVLSGDKGDCIEGLKAISAIEKKEILKNTGVKIDCRVGEITAKKILKNSKNYFITVARVYIIRGQKKDFKINYKLLKL